MFRIRFEISHFDRHPVRFAVAVSADLSADLPPGCVKGSAADVSKVVHNAKALVENILGSFLGLTLERITDRIAAEPRAR